MKMINFIIFGVSVWALSNILVKEYVTKFIRNIIKKTKINFLIKLFNCPMCISVWISIPLHYILDNQWHIIISLLLGYGFTKILELTISKNEFTLND